MKIHYKLSNAYICNSGICFQTTFVMVKGLTQQIILGTPFLNLIEPFMVTSKGIIFETDGQNIMFDFISQPQVREIDMIKETLIYKENQINFLRKDLNHSYQA